MARHCRLPPMDHEEMRREADDFFGEDDRVGHEDPWERRQADGR